MTPWQRRLRAGIAIFGVGFAIFVYVAIRQPKAPPERARPVEREDPSAAMESTGCELLQLRGEREHFRVACERSLVYEDGRQRIFGVRISIAQRQERDYTITAREATVGDNQQQIDLKDDVELTTSDGMVVRASEASYHQGEGILRSSGPVSFSRGRHSGTAVGMTYEEKRNLLWLLDRAVLRMAGATSADPPVDIAAGAAGFARSDHYIRFERGFKLVNGSRVLESAQATAYLTEDESRVQMLEMRGQSRVTGVGDTSGALRGLSAQDMNLEFADDGRTLSAATLSRDGVVEVAGSGPESRRIAGHWIDIRMAADGTTVTSLLARDAVRLDLPGDAETPARTVSAAELVARGEGGDGLRSAVFSDAVEFREFRTAPGVASPRVVRARTLTLTVQPGFGAVDDASFSGAVRFEDGAVRATAAHIAYAVSAGTLQLEGADEETAKLPEIADERISIVGQTIAFTMAGRKIVATGDVRSTLRPMAPAEGAGGAEAKRPSMLRTDQAVFATAGSLAYEGDKKLAVYTTGARLWQGDTAIQAESITLDEATGNLSASGTVRSVLMLDHEAPPATSAGAPAATAPAARAGASSTAGRTPTVARAEQLVYDESARRASYRSVPTAGAEAVPPAAGTPAHVAGPQGDLRASTVDLYLAPSGAELERVEAYGQVVLKLDARQATGDRLTYFTAGQRYEMVGAPVKLEAQCRDTVGRALTFFRANDTITVDGNNEFRTFTRGGAKCEEPRKQ